MPIWDGLFDLYNEALGKGLARLLADGFLGTARGAANAIRDNAI